MKKNENNWSESVKKAVWKKGRINPDYSPRVLRWDRNGHVMMWSEYGKVDSKFGWGIGTIDLDPGPEPAQRKVRDRSRDSRMEPDQGKDPGRNPGSKAGKDPGMKAGILPEAGGNNIENLQPINLWYENN